MRLNIEPDAVRAMIESAHHNETTCCEATADNSAHLLAVCENHCDGDCEGQYRYWGEDWQVITVEMK